MLAHKQQNTQANLSEPEPALDPITLAQPQEDIGDLTPILQTVFFEILAQLEREAERVIASLTVILTTRNRHFQHRVASQ